MEEKDEKGGVIKKVKDDRKSNREAVKD